MIAAIALLTAPAHEPSAFGECACHLPIGPHVDEEGRAFEIEWVPCDGHRWYKYPLCVKCGDRFAAPQHGRICCVCLGKLYGKCNDCGKISYVPAVDGVCEECRDFAELIADSDATPAYDRILARRLAKAAQSTSHFDTLGATPASQLAR